MNIINDYISDVLFPRRCMGCGVEGIYLCNKCRIQIPLNNKFYCPFCGQPSFLGSTCFSCQKEKIIDGVWVASSYQNEILKRCIKAYKYNLVRELAVPLGDLLVKYYKLVEEAVKLQPFELIVPVPLHKRKHLERGFNQAELLAEEIRMKIGIACKKSLCKRNKYTLAQVDLDNKRRRENIKDAFGLTDSNLIKNKRILIIDDVMTTGSTLNEIAKILKKSGAKFVWGLVLAKN